MTKRTHTLTSGGILLMLCLCSVSLVTAAETGNERESFNKGWLFARFGPMPDGKSKQEPKNLEAANLRDAKWRKLDLPHDWGIEGPFRDDLPSNTGKLPWAGIGWYRKHFQIAEALSGKRVFLEFEGANQVSEFWLNGKSLGLHKGGYTGFEFEIKRARRPTPPRKKDNDRNPQPPEKTPGPDQGV